MSNNGCAATIVCCFLGIVFFVLMFLICGCGDIIDTACDPDFVTQPDGTVFGIKQVIISVIMFIALIVFFNRRRLFNAKT